MDRRYLHYLARNCGGGPAGVETLAAALGDQRDVLEDVIEPYLIQQGLLQRTQRGRMLTLQGWRYLGLDAPRGAAEQLDLIEAEPDVQEAGNG
jgi:Holliday junction DNA helicase RuvB